MILTFHRRPFYIAQESVTSSCHTRSYPWELLRLSRLRMSVQANNGMRSVTNSMSALTSSAMARRSNATSPSRP